MKKTLMMLAALMTIALFAGCSDDDDDVLTPPDDSTEQSENTDNQGEENEGDEDEGDENQGDDQGDDQGDEDEGDENQGDEDEGDENQGDENDGDDNDGDDNDGDDNDGDDNDGDDDTTGGVVPSDKVTEWGASVWEDLGTNTYPSEEVTTDDFTYSDGLLSFVNGSDDDGDGKGVKFGKTLSTYCAKLQGKGNATKDCLQFKVNTNGTLKVAVTSGNKDDERSVQVYVDGEAYGDALSCPGYNGLAEPKEHSVEVTGISGETTIAIASANSGNNIFVIGWTPDGVE